MSTARPVASTCDGAEVCDLSSWVELRNWPDGTRMLWCCEDDHPGAQL